MFDIGFFEIAFLFLVALLVLGPERLPGLARTLGGWLRRARSMASGMREELDRELATDDWKREIQQQREHLEELQKRLDADIGGSGSESDR